MRVGDRLPTPYGEGILRNYREVDKTYCLDLGFGKLYAHAQTIGQAIADAQAKADEAKNRSAMELNAAYESLETIRRLNLEVACDEQGIYPVRYDVCSICLLEGKFRKPKNSKANSPSFPRLQRLVGGGATNAAPTNKNAPEVVTGTPATACTSAPTAQSSTSSSSSRLPHLSRLVKDTSQLITTTSNNATDTTNASTSTASKAATTTPSQTAPAKTSSPFPQLSKLVQETSQLLQTPTMTSTSTTNQSSKDCSSQQSMPRLSLLMQGTSTYMARTTTQAANAISGSTTRNHSNTDRQSNSSAPMSQPKTNTTVETASSQSLSTKSQRFPRLSRFVDQTSQLVNPSSSSNNNNSSPNKNTTSSPPALVSASGSKVPACLTCGAPVCSKHSSSEFRSLGITVCRDCEQLFKLEFLIQCLSLPEADQKRAHMDRMMALYDRTTLLLKYSQPYMDQVVEQLEVTQKRNNQINMGGSSVGMMSGVLGIAAAAAVFTPAAAPLLIASLVFGGGATAVQTGAEVKTKYFSEPHQFADRVVALHGMLVSILGIMGTLRDAATQDCLRTDDWEDADKIFKSRDWKDRYQSHTATVLAGINAGRLGVAAAAASTKGFVAVAETSLAAGSAAELTTMTTVTRNATNARLMSRTGSNLMKTARFARFAGGALSAAILVMEARSMNQTLQAIRDGDPCAKAQTLREIEGALSGFPSTEELDRECQSYLDYMIGRDRRMTQDQAVQLLLEVAELSRQHQLELQINDEKGQLILDGIEEEDDKRSSPEVSSTLSSSSTLLDRINTFKKRERKESPAVEDGQWKQPVVVSKDVSDDLVSLQTRESTSTPSISLASSANLLDRIERFKQSTANPTDQE